MWSWDSKEWRHAWKYKTFRSTDNAEEVFSHPIESWNFAENEANTWIVENKPEFTKNSVTLKARRNFWHETRPF